MVKIFLKNPLEGHHVISIQSKLLFTGKHHYSGRAPGEMAVFERPRYAEMRILERMAHVHEVRRAHTEKQVQTAHPSSALTQGYSTHSVQT